MTFGHRVFKFYEYFERVIVVVLLVLLMIVVLAATGMMSSEIVTSLWGRLHGVMVADTLEHSGFFTRLRLLNDVFGGFLLILIGLELMKTVVMYLDRHELHVEVVFTVAMIAVARHAIGMDLADTPPLTLVGMGVLVLALALGHYFFKKSSVLPPADTRSQGV